MENNQDHINPKHYKHMSKEVWQMMCDIWGVNAFLLHCEMSAFKYRMRAGLKDGQPVERDIEKAKWYEEQAKTIRERKE